MSIDMQRLDQAVQNMGKCKVGGGHIGSRRHEGGRIHYFCQGCGQSTSVEDTEALMEIGRAVFTIWRLINGK